MIYSSTLITLLQYVVVFILKFIVSSSGDNDLDRLEEFKVFYSLNYTFHEFKQYSNSTFVRQMMDMFIAHCPINPLEIPYVRKHPFIVIDSSHRRTRSIVSRQVARKINGKFIYNPPRFMIKNKRAFNYTISMKRAFFALGIFGASYKAKHLIADYPVVLNGYFLDQVNFGIDKKFEKPPPANSSIYKWPRELLKPDWNFFINAPTLTKPTNASITSELRTQRLLKIYDHWEKPRTIVINSTAVYREMINIIVKRINKEMNTTYNSP